MECTATKLLFVCFIGILISWSIILTQPPLPLPNKAQQQQQQQLVVLRDGRRLTCREAGVPKEEADHKAVYVHSFGGSRHEAQAISQEVLAELKVYMVSYDRAGYGGSDPNPGRSIQSEVHDIEDLAEAFQLGDKFYLVANSIGGYSAWACLHHIPHRLAGVVMFAPVTNFWWRGIPTADFRDAFATQAIGDKIALILARYVPRLSHFWTQQEWFPKLSAAGKQLIQHCNQMDRDIMLNSWSANETKAVDETPVQEVYYSLVEDLNAMFGKWEFDPSQIANPNVSVHIWQGDGDYLVPVLLQRYVHKVAPWVRYHELAGVGHLLLGVPGLTQAALRCLLRNQCNFQI